MGQNENKGRVFTSRQEEVLALVARRLTIKEIAAELGVSESAINQRIRAMKERAGVNTHRELAELHAATYAERADAYIFEQSSAYSETACRISPLETDEEFQKEAAWSKPKSAFSFHDSQAFRLDAPWMEFEEPRVVPRVLDGPNAVWFRIAGILVIAVALMVTVILGLTTLQAITNAIESYKAVPEVQTTGLPQEHGKLGRP